jgi:hypothetical protein
MDPFRYIRKNKSRYIPEMSTCASFVLLTSYLINHFLAIRFKGWLGSNNKWRLLRGSTADSDWAKNKFVKTMSGGERRAFLKCTLSAQVYGGCPPGIPFKSGDGSFDDIIHVAVFSQSLGTSVSHCQNQSTIQESLYKCHVLLTRTSQMWMHAHSNCLPQ